MMTRAVREDPAQADLFSIEASLPVTVGRCVTSSTMPLTHLPLRYKGIDYTRDPRLVPGHQGDRQTAATISDIFAALRIRQFTVVRVAAERSAILLVMNKCASPL